jgi:hypothetical protein
MRDHHRKDRGECQRPYDPVMDRGAAQYNPHRAHPDQHCHAIDEACQNRMRREFDDMADADHAERYLPKAGEHQADRQCKASESEIAGVWLMRQQGGPEARLNKRTAGARRGDYE